MLISNAWAAPDATQTAASGLMGFVPLILVFVIFYFILIRPQMKKQKEHAAMLKALQKGEKVVTAGGLIGVIIKVDAEQQIVHLEIAPGVTVKVVRGGISEKVSADSASVDPEVKAEAKKSKRAKAE
jgi:preprotein translocase subunit YajC